MQVAQAAAALQAHCTDGDAVFVGCSTDSRSCQRQQLFVALEGPQHDGHQYVGEAGKRGAAAALVSPPVEAPVPMIRVTDTLHALGRLAGVWRDRFDLPVIGVTGSNGKTTVKELLASLLRDGATVLATRGTPTHQPG